MQKAVCGMQKAVSALRVACRRLSAHYKWHTEGCKSTESGMQKTASPPRWHAEGVQGCEATCWHARLEQHMWHAGCSTTVACKAVVPHGAQVFLPHGGGLQGCRTTLWHAATAAYIQPVGPQSGMHGVCPATRSCAGGRWVSVPTASCCTWLMGCMGSSAMCSCLAG